MKNRISKFILCLYFIPQAVCLAQPFQIPLGSSPNLEDSPFSLKQIFEAINSNNIYFRDNSGGGGSNGITPPMLQGSLTSGTNQYVAKTGPSLGFDFQGGGLISELAFGGGGATHHTIELTPGTATGGGVSAIIFHGPVTATSFAGDGSLLTGVSSAVPDPLTIGTLNATTANATAVNGNGAGVTNVDFSKLFFTPITTASPTNPVVGFLNFTNGGRWYRIPVCTNLP